MTDSTTDATHESDTKRRWSLLGVGGALSLCCLFTATATAGGAGVTAAGGTTAALGGGVVRVAVAAATVGVLALVVRS